MLYQPTLQVDWLQRGKNLLEAAELSVRQQERSLGISFVSPEESLTVCVCARLFDNTRTSLYTVPHLLILQ